MAEIAMSKAVSFGNGCDIDAATLMDYLLDDPETDYVGAYIEGITDGGKFMKALRALAAKKPTLIWKGLIKQTGALMVEGLEELVDTMTALVHLRRKGKRVAIIGPSGAVGVFSSDVAHSFGLSLPAFQSETQKMLKRWFKTPGRSRNNPLDTGAPTLDHRILTDVMQEVLLREPVDCLIVVLQLHQLGVLRPVVARMEGLPVPELGEYLEGFLRASVKMKNRTGKDIVAAFHNRANLPTDLETEGSCRLLRLRYNAKGIPVYLSVERALRAIKNSANFRPLSA
ncbi:hypothetical protein ACFL9T_06490 [Thermodesulfobacteriota bacterium]